MESFELQYMQALIDLRRLGELKQNRTGTPAVSGFHWNAKFDVSEHYPILTGKFIDINIINTEFEWFITGKTNTNIFKERGIKIWDQWADESGELGPVYGHQLVNFNSQGYNQLTKVISGLKENPNSRRHIISLWNPLQLDQMALPPCYLYFQFYVQEGTKLNMFVVQRSGDMFVGIPYDVCLFTNLLGYVANCTGLEANCISLNVVDAHMYRNHVEASIEYLGRKLHEPPTWSQNLFGETILHNYEHEARIKVQVAK